MEPGRIGAPFIRTITVKILTVDDHALVREGLQVTLARALPEAEFAEAGSGAELFNLLEDHPDASLLLLDVQLPDASGLDLLEPVFARRPGLPVVMLSAEHDPLRVSEAIDRGARGFISKSAAGQVLVSAIQLVLAGGIYLPPEMLKGAVAGRLPVPPTQMPPPPMARLLVPDDRTPTEPGTEPDWAAYGLTDRQVDVLRLLLQGSSNKQICRQLGLAEPTVKIHVRAILRALDVGTRTEVVVLASRLGWSAQGSPAAAG